MNKKCEKLEKKYNQVVEMFKGSFNFFKQEKEKKNASIMAYKKRVTEQLKELQNSVESQEKMIDSYKKQNLELTRENLLLKNKFKKTALLFSKSKENNLIFKYFKDIIEIEDFLEHIVNKILKEEFDLQKITPLYFRKELNNVLNRYLIKELTLYTKIEKMSLLLSSIIKERFRNKIYFFIASFFVDRIEKEKYSEFVQILLTKTLVDKNTKYQPIQMEYSVDDIKMIYSRYKKLSFKKQDLLIKIDLEKVDKEISDCLAQIDENEKKLEELSIEENEILVKLTTLEEEENKEKLEDIDIQKRKIIDNISKLKKELELLENKRLFLEPENEVVFENSLNKKEKYIVEKYNTILHSFTFALERELI